MLLPTDAPHHGKGFCAGRRFRQYLLFTRASPRRRLIPPQVRSIKNAPERLLLHCRDFQTALAQRRQDASLPRSARRAADRVKPDDKANDD